MSSYITRKTPGNTEWFMQDRFGMFIHFGIYAMPARHEWIKRYEFMPEEKYDKYFKYFNPDLYDPADLAKKAKKAGMKYVVITTKHHDGFCLFDSKYTDYKATNTPAGRDLVREYVDAFRAEGLRIGLYYSLLDWHHPDFTIDGNHPRREDPDAEQQNAGRDMKVYAQYMRNQLEELLTNYGKIELLFFDFSYPDYDIPYMPWVKGKSKDDWESEELLALVRRLQPEIIINNRTGIDQDFWTPEQRQVKEWVKHKDTGELVPWVACHTLSGAWGYFRDEATWKSPEMLILLLINSVSFGGNLIMNVGPTARGCLDDRAEAALEVYANWMKYNSRSIYGCTMAEPEFKAPNGCYYTQSEDGKRLYVHLAEYPFKGIELPGLAGKIDYAQFLHDGSEVILSDGSSQIHGDEVAGNKECLFIELPIIKPNVVIPVIELFLK